MRPRFSVIVPARNEEAFIGKCLASIEAAAAPFPPGAVEKVVVLNRCTDGTETIARSFGAIITREEGKNLSRIRNKGVESSTGEIVVTLDADSVVSPTTLQEIERALATGRYVGGGVWITPERLSLGIALTGLLVLLVLARQGTFVGLFFCRREDFDAIGGFDESFVSIEDIDFAKRLKRHGRTLGKRYANLTRARITTSCRKFDRFGDWYFIRNPRLSRSLFTGQHREHADKVWYDFER
jgi:glycosyltransferase involved in cell wall biosynthesis